MGIDRWQKGRRLKEAARTGNRNFQGPKKQEKVFCFILEQDFEDLSSKPCFSGTKTLKVGVFNATKTLALPGAKPFAIRLMEKNCYANT